MRRRTRARARVRPRRARGPARATANRRSAAPRPRRQRSVPRYAATNAGFVARRRSRPGHRARRPARDLRPRPRPPGRASCAVGERLRPDQRDAIGLGLGGREQHRGEVHAAGGYATNRRTAVPANGTAFDARSPRRRNDASDEARATSERAGVRLGSRSRAEPQRPPRRGPGETEVPAAVADVSGAGWEATLREHPGYPGALTRPHPRPEPRSRARRPEGRRIAGGASLPSVPGPPSLYAR